MMGSMFSNPWLEGGVSRLLLISLLGIVGCGDDSAGPESTAIPTGVTGSWSYSTTVTTTGVSCTISGAALSLKQSGNTFTGTYTGVISCSGSSGGGGGSARGTVVSGIVSGSAIQFDFDNTQWHQTGTLDGNNMSGNVNAHILDANGAPMLLTGSWSAVRK
jgi:hypothetical protein